MRINFVGDVALFHEFEQQGCDPFSNIDLPPADFNVANFEFPVPPDEAEKSYFDVDPAYRVTDKFCRGLKLDKFDAYGLANNHITDYGLGGIRNTEAILLEQGCGVFGVGLDAINAYKVELENIAFLFVAFVKPGRWDRAPGVKGPDRYDIDTLETYIANEKDSADHIIAFPHWGTELVDAPDPSDVANARRLIDAGASCVIGHHPHVIQGCERYKDGLIAYSLGSFIYLPDCEKGNVDRSPLRDISLCLNISFSKDRIEEFTPHRFRLDRTRMIPISEGDCTSTEEYRFLCSVIGSKKYYSQRVRTILLRRELHAFFFRLKQNPFHAMLHYLKYIRPRHFKKILGIS